MNMKSIPYGRQDISEEDIQMVVDTLKSDYLTQGPRIKEFEIAFAKYVGADYAVAVSNGTAALHISAIALDVKPGQKIITTPITFAASANCVKYCGGDVVFADIDPKTYLIDVNEIKKLLEAVPKNTYAGIIPVDFAGYAVNLEELKQLADEYGFWIIEDACHAPGGFFIDSKGSQQKCGNGNYANLSVFSFHPVKHIACGEGGMITTNDKKLYEKLLILRTHGITKDPSLMKKNDGGWYYEMQELGYNYRLTDFQAALGISQLKKIDKGLKRRREIASIYADAFQHIEQIFGQSWVIEGHAYHLYIIEVKDRLKLYNYLHANNILVQVHYIPVHTLKYYKNSNIVNAHLKAAEVYYDHCISLPMFAALTDIEQQYVIDKVKQYFYKNES